MLTKTSGTKPDAGLADKPERSSPAIARRNAETLADQIAGDKFHYKNFFYPGGADAFLELDLRLVDKYYPNALGGPILVDEPMLPYQVRRCDLKRTYLEKHGFRYLVITPTSTVEECLIQLGGE